MLKPGIRVLCVSDHAVVRDGLGLIVDRQFDMTTVGCASTGEAALELFRQARPDVTLMDLQVPGLSGLDTIKAIRLEDSQAPIVVLSMHEGDEDIYRALQAGATTYLLKNTLSDDLVRVGTRGGCREAADSCRGRNPTRVAHP